ncbi:GNAT family N-acetyltransferase [Streptomyces collinus]|uniref:GNAT family N-acetyltransferase n=1 Tax=Streptomyces collinus TaxID=42684 RepID=UPI0033D3FDA8
MLPDGWQLTEDIDDFLARAGDFLQSRPALHNTPLTDIEKLRTRGADAHGAEATVFGLLESGGEVCAIFYRRPRGQLWITPLWETPDGTPVSMAASTSIVGGMIRVDPVYTPAHLRGRGYAGAVTAEVSRAALAAGATDVVLFTDPTNPTSNALYQRIGYVRVGDFTGYKFSYIAPEAG